MMLAQQTPVTTTQASRDDIDLDAWRKVCESLASRDVWSRLAAMSDSEDSCDSTCAGGTSDSEPESLSDGGTFTPEPPSPRSEKALEDDEYNDNYVCFKDLQPMSETTASPKQMSAGSGTDSGMDSGMEESPKQTTSAAADSGMDEYYEFLRSMGCDFEADQDDDEAGSDSDSEASEAEGWQFVDAGGEEAEENEADTVADVVEEPTKDADSAKISRSSSYSNIDDEIVLPSMVNAGPSPWLLSVLAVAAAAKQGQLDGTDSPVSDEML